MPTLLRHVLLLLVVPEARHVPHVRMRRRTLRMGLIWDMHMRSPGLHRLLLTRTSLGALTALALVAGVSGCTPGTHPPPASRPSLSPSPICTGRDGEAVLRAFFDDLSSGKKGLVATYFVAPLDFVRWSDPTSGLITFLPGPDNDTVTLDALQAHLDSLQQQGAHVTLTRFRDAGFEADKTNGEAGGWFSFDIRGSPNGRAAVKDGNGKGAVDCGTKKLKALVIHNW